eukprot:COSAG05_NODE_771_length_7443_cov_8.561138_3_plen_577_part_00
MLKQPEAGSPSTMGGNDCGRPAKAPRTHAHAPASGVTLSQWSATVGGTHGRRYVPVGAVVVAAPLTQPTRVALEKPGWLKQICCRIHRFGAKIDGQAPLMAVHVSPVGAAALDAALAAVAEGGKYEEILPPPASDLAAILQSGEAKWHPGLRIGDAVSAGGLGPHWHLLPGDLQKMQTATKTSIEPEARSTVLPGRFRFIELFAGIGGFRSALTPLGGECVFASEVGEEERQTYFHNYNEFPASDITETPCGAVPSHTLLTAGFPCQSFCQAGLQKGFSDARGELFFEVIRIARRHRPAVLLLENVPNLLLIDAGAALATILAEIRALGYSTHHMVLSSRSVVPQSRKRLYIVAFLDAAKHAAFSWPARLLEGTGNHAPTIGDAATGVGRSATAGAETPFPTVRDILEPAADVPAELTLSLSQWKKVREAAERKGQYELPPLVDRAGAARTLIASYKSARSHFTEFVGDEDCTVALVAIAKRKCGQGEASAGGEGGGAKAAEFTAVLEAMPPPRFYTVRECARLQGFSEQFKLMWPGQKNPNRLYHQLGNAVSPATVALLGQAILNTGALDNPVVL